mmetsp:Transcript_33847/g.70356  ORF Transcript_33847/g.70356 Transcript_33847/m.70356 type:complete len:86 (+) Transcript_33847:506-763(+)
MYHRSTQPIIYMSISPAIVTRENNVDNRTERDATLEQHSIMIHSLTPDSPSNQQCVGYGTEGGVPTRYIEEWKAKPHDDSISFHW